MDATKILMSLPFFNRFKLHDLVNFIPKIKIDIIGKEKLLFTNNKKQSNNGGGND